MNQVTHTTETDVARSSTWRAVGRPTELHLYAKVGHGFALDWQRRSPDAWIDRLWEWLAAEGFIPAPGPER
jgi:hypothetical protein